MNYVVVEEGHVIHHRHRELKWKKERQIIFNRKQNVDISLDVQTALAADTSHIGILKPRD
jgi:hypothetical protein